MIRKPVQTIGLLAVLLGLLLPGCISIKSHRNNDPYTIRHHTWWNYYQRGRLHLRDGNATLAAQDFETALGLRPGARYPYAVERWRVRTYGMHTMEGYFPHRELAVSLYKINKPHEALRLLEKSMQMEPSARAKFYLNRVHKDLAVAAASPPVLKLDSTPPWTPKRSIVVSGQAAGSNKVAQVTINGVGEFVELAADQIRFRREVELEEGQNVVQITVADVSGKETATNLQVMADFTPPEIHIVRNASALEITCRDNLGIGQTSVNGSVATPKGMEYVINWPLPANQTLDLGITDLAGNKMEWSLPKEEAARLAKIANPIPPQLELAHAGETITLFNGEYELDLRAEDDAALQSLQLNGKELLFQPAPFARVSRRVPLSLGTNVLVVSATDFDGNYSETQTTILRRQPEYLDTKFRLSAMQSLVEGELASTNLAHRINLAAANELTAYPPRFFLVASPEDGIHLERELSLASGNQSDPRAWLKKGKKLDADLVLVNRVLHDAPGHTVYTRVLDAESGNELFVEDVYLEDEVELPYLIRGLVMKIEQRFPLLKGHVHRFEKHLTIDSGSENGAHEGMRLLVVRSEGAFEQGRVVYHKDRPAELVVSGVESASAQVILPRRQPNGSVRHGDYVFAR